MDKSIGGNQKNALEQSVYLDDFFAVFLTTVFRLNPITFSVATAVVISMTCLFTAWMSNVLISGPNNVGFLQDWLGWIWALIIHPVLGGSYLWSALAISNLGCKLKNIDNISLTDKEINSFFERNMHGWCRLIALGIATLGSIIYYSLRADLSTWTSSAFWPKFVTSIFVFIAIYMASMLAFNLLINVAQIHYLFDGKEVQLDPLHPDRCGGLKSLSEYSLKTAYIVAFFGLMLGLGWFRFYSDGISIEKYWFLFPLTFLYVVASLFCFFGPLLSVHKIMKDSKDKFLRALSEQFQSDYMELQISLSEDVEYLTGKVQKIEKLQKIYDLTNQFPVWPFDAPTIRKYAISVSTPLLPTLIKMIQELIVSFK